MAAIAVIDSNPTRRTIVTAALRRSGHDVRQWARLTPARHALLARAPDLLLVASELPDGSGLDLAARPRTFPIVVLTADADDRARIAATGAATVALRSHDVDPLLRLVDRLLHLPRRDDKERGGALARPFSSQPKGAQARPHEEEGLSVGSRR